MNVSEVGFRKKHENVATKLGPDGKRGPDAAECTGSEGQPCGGSKGESVSESEGGWNAAYAKFGEREGGDMHGQTS